MIKGLVSIVIPTYCGEHYLATAIESCLLQTYTHLEVIVVDDCSPTQDADIASGYAGTDSRVRVIRRAENGMISRALNTGFAAARGEFHSRLAQDDLFHPDAIQRLVDALTSHPSAGLAYADMELIDEHGVLIHPMLTESPDRALMPANRVGLCVMWPASVFHHVGGFDPRFDLSEDYEFFLRISREYHLVKSVGSPVFYFRYHPQQGSVTKEHKHDLARARVHVSHALAMSKRYCFSPQRWKNVVAAFLRLWATQLGIYSRIKHDRK